MADERKKPQDFQVPLHLPGQVPPEWRACPPGGSTPHERLAILCEILHRKSCRICGLNESHSPLFRYGTAIALERSVMLRITTNQTPRVVTLRLEGRLEGPWVEVLTQSWFSTVASSENRRLCVDLNGMTFVDGDGEARLAQMYAQGAEFIADDLMTKAVVAGIAGRKVADTHERATEKTSRPTG